MKFHYKKKHYSEQLKRPQKKRSSSRFTIVDEAQLLDWLYNDQYHTNERLYRETVRNRAKIRDIENRLKSDYKYLYKSLTKIFSNMKNQTINEASTLNESNFRSNLIEFLGTEAEQYLNLLDWSKFDDSNKGTINTTFKLMLDENETAKTGLDTLEEAKSQQFKKEAKEAIKQAKAMKEALASATTTEEKLAILAEFGF